MNDLISPAFRIALFVAAGLLVVWAVVPSGQALSAGAILGIAGSMFNIILLKRRIERVGQFDREEKSVRIGLGFGTRTATVLLVVMIAMRFPEHISLISAIAGCFFMPIILLVVGIMNNRK